MKPRLLHESMPYTGQELAPHWIYKNFGILGDAIVAFQGECNVKLEDMVDLEDVLNDDSIYSTNMLHFIIELFNVELMEGVMLQRLFSSILQQRINEALEGYVVERRGDDLFFQQTKKLSVSICTKSATSILIHAGLNIESMNAPVEAAGLTSDLGLDDEAIKHLANSAMNSFADELKDMRLACCKVRAV